MTRRPFLIVAGVILLVAGLARGAWLTADPPTDQAGIVWHDEGAWTHNARNKALWGAWRTDAWNPVFIAPVFTALEYGAFEVLGVGTWQARVVPAVSGVVAIAALMFGVGAMAGRKAALLAGALLATSFTFIMWNRAALMESTMTAFIVLGWAAYAGSERRPWLASLAGAFAVAAFFTKAAAAFFIAALALEWLHTVMAPSRPPAVSPSRHLAAGLVLAAAVVGVAFVLPWWTEFQFYNWEMTVTRKPSYGLADLARRTSWLPLVHGTFSRMWLVLAVAAVAVIAIVRRWPDAHRGERLAVWWLLVGLAELIIHDSGNERRYVMFVPVLIALAASRWSDRAVAPQRTGDVARWREGAVVLLSVPLAYLVFGSLLRLVWLDEVLAGDLRAAARLSGALAVATGLVVWWFREEAARRRSARPPAAVMVLAAASITVATDAAWFWRWSATRTYLNVEASRQLGGLLPPGTLVHGKLANGLALENQIKPVFVGRGFGNYADRLDRDDARYILSYTEADGRPEPGYEGDVILEVLQHYPQRRLVVEFDVQETPGRDRAALIDKLPDGPDPRARDK